MKKAKIMLSAIVVLGIAGGAFAFTAQKAIDTTPLFSCDAANSKCDLPTADQVPNFTTTVIVGAPTVTFTNDRAYTDATCVDGTCTTILYEND